MTEITSAVASSLAGILAINQNIAALVEEAKTKRKEAMQPFLDALAASGQVSVIYMRGYTPGFNDGEPCEHSADFWVNLQQLHENDELEDLGDNFGLELDLGEDEGFQGEKTWSHGVGYQTVPGAAEANLALATKLGHVWAPPSTEILSAIDTLIFTTVEEEEGTDYWVSYILEDGKFVRRSGEYECGY